jgi:hypothetical protein
VLILTVCHKFGLMVLNTLPGLTKALARAN